MFSGISIIGFRVWLASINIVAWILVLESWSSLRMPPFASDVRKARRERFVILPVRRYDVEGDVSLAIVSGSHSLGLRSRLWVLNSWPFMFYTCMLWISKHRLEGRCAHVLCGQPRSKEIMLCNAFLLPLCLHIFDESIPLLSYRVGQYTLLACLHISWMKWSVVCLLQGGVVAAAVPPHHHSVAARNMDGRTASEVAGRGMYAFLASVWVRITFTAQTVAPSAAAARLGTRLSPSRTAAVHRVNVSVTPSPA